MYVQHLDRYADFSSRDESTQAFLSNGFDIVLVRAHDRKVGY